MIKPSKTKYATENFVWGVVNNLEEKVEKGFDKVDKKAEKRYNKMMTQLVDIAGQFKKFGEEQTILSVHSRNHTDRIEKLENAAFAAS
jgi:hypothetical protein